MLRILRTHGITANQPEFKTNHTEPWYQEMHHLGFNYRLTDIQAALGLSQLSKVDQFIKRRREIAKVYLDFFDVLSDKVETIPEREHEFHSYHLFVIKLVNPKKRRELYEFLKKKEIHCQVHYIPIHRHPYYEQLGYREDSCPNAERFYETVLSLPMYPALSNEELEHVLSSFRAFFR